MPPLTGTGRRIAKAVTEGPNSQTTYYLNSDSALMAEANEAGQITKAYGFNPNTHDAEEELWSTDPVWQADIHNGSLKSSQTRYHYNTTDHLGTPVLATNKSGNKTWRSYSEAFGNTATESTAGTQINLRFPGQYWDKETGLHQNFFRDYSPARGRYVQSDPTGLWGGINTYGYAYNDPLGYIDPTGEVPIAPIVWNYFRCVARCTASSTIAQGITGEIDCWPNTLTENAQDCALSCANPLNWFGGKFKAQGSKVKRPKTGKNDSHINQESKKRAKEEWEKKKKELEDLRAKPNKTPEDKRNLEKLKRQVDHLKKQADKTGETHHTRDQGR